jgi:hypothetical protein
MLSPDLKDMALDTKELTKPIHVEAAGRSP